MTPAIEHPSPELLADFGSGTLTEGERGSVRAHLATCAQCAGEVADASAGRAALAGLKDVAAPAGVAERALAEAAGESSDQPSGPDWYRWGGIVAVVAAFAIVLTLVLPRIGGGGSGDRAATSANAGGTTKQAPVLIEISPTNFHSASLTKLADHVTANAVNAPVAAEVTGAATPAAVAGTAQQTATASACVQQAFRQVDGNLVRLIQARFEGTKAYVALYAESPGAGQPADAITIRVASAADCTPLSIAQAPLAPSP